MLWRHFVLLTYHILNLKKIDKNLYIHVRSIRTSEKCDWSVFNSFRVNLSLIHLRFLTIKSRTTEVVITRKPFKVSGIYEYIKTKAHYFKMCLWQFTPFLIAHYVWYFHLVLWTPVLCDHKNAYQAITDLFLYPRRSKMHNQEW